MDLADFGPLIRERREALGLSQSRLARFSGLSRHTLVGLGAGALSDLGFNRVSQVLAVLGLDLDPPIQVARAEAEPVEAVLPSGPWEVLFQLRSGWQPSSPSAVPARARTRRGCSSPA